MQATEEREALRPPPVPVPSAPSRDAERATTALGRYRLGARLGSGGFGTVYAAHDERLRRPVAVKVIPADGPAPERAQREARAVARLDHPAIVALYDAGEDEGGRYLVSELVEGRTLAELEKAGELSDRDVLRAGLALADALGHAHERGVIHRDVKPQNVLVPTVHSADWLARRTPAKLTDFGVAHLAGDEPLTHTGDVVGTLAYMAPEQAAGQRVDERADLYSLGLVLYEALAGVNPVNAGSPAATARRVGTALPPLHKRRKDLPEELCAAIDQTVRPDPEERGTIDDLFDALADALPLVSDEGGAIAPHPLERRIPALPPALGRLVAPAAAAGLVAVALAGLVPDPPLSAGLAAAITAALVAVLPRAGWLIAAAATIALVGFGSTPRPGAAFVLLVLAAPAPLLLRSDGWSWSLPAAAPVLGLAGLAGAYPALAGRAPRAWTRGALGALGVWWLVFAEPFLERVLLFGATEGTPPRAAFDGAVSLAASEVVARALSSGALLLAPVWAAAALVLPWIVRGRSLSADAVGATAWAAGLAAATATLGEAIGSVPSPAGLVLSALLAGVGALALGRGWSSHTLAMQSGGTSRSDTG
jgi:hypothetical protein